jgi:hypothetical protein
VRVFPIASALVLTVALAACSRSEAPPAAPETPAAAPPVEAAPPPGPSASAAAKANLPRVASVELGSALDPNKRVVEPKSAFATTDTIYASIATEGWGEPIELTARWTYEDGQLVSESQAIAAPGPGITEFHIEKPDGWPVGSYQLEILAGEAPVSTQRFEVR